MHNSDIMLALHPSWEDSISFIFLRKLKNVPQWGRTFIWKQPAYVWLSEKKVGQLAELISVILETLMNGNLDSIKKLIFASFYHV